MGCGPGRLLWAAHEALLTPPFVCPLANPPSPCLPQTCRQSVCLKHRHSDDHKCPGQPAPSGDSAARRAQAAAAAVGAQVASLIGRTRSGGGGAAAALRAAASSAAVQRAAVSPAVAADPSNSVHGTAERRRHQLAAQQAAAAAAGGGSSGWLPQLWGAQTAVAAPAAPREIVDLTVDGGVAPAAARQQLQEEHRAAAAAARAAGHEFACLRCGAGFSDPVALVEHDERCAAGGAAARSGSNCRLS
jgi:hypothetical protein